MRPLALELYFDTASEQRLASVWEKLAGYCHHSTASQLGVVPHITLALFRDSLPNDLVGVGKALATGVSPFDVNLCRVDRFPGDEGVVFLAPAPSPELTGAHERAQELLGEDRDRVDPYYRPGAWRPHCTMAINVPEPRVSAVISACSYSDALGVATISGVQVVRYRPAEREWTSALASPED